MCFLIMTALRDQTRLWVENAQSFPLKTLDQWHKPSLLYEKQTLTCIVQRSPSFIFRLPKSSSKNDHEWIDYLSKSQNSLPTSWTVCKREFVLENWMLKRWNPDRPHMIVSLFSWCGLGFAIIPWPHQMETAEWCGALTHLHWIQPKTIPDQAWNWALSPYWCTHRWPRKKKKKSRLTVKIHIGGFYIQSVLFFGL